MSTPAGYTPHPDLDLVLERVIDVPPSLVWAAWTQPEHIKQWFTPRPWTTPEVEVDLRPGGHFRNVMVGPNGERMDNVGCYLEMIPDQRLVWTSALGPGFRPQSAPEGAFTFTAMILIEPHGDGARYTAIVSHGRAEDAAKHRDMGFHHGWGAALDQLVAHMKAIS